MSNNDLKEGTKLDDEKVRLDLFPYDALVAISHVLTFGARKYADRNWEKGIKWGRVFGAAQRHLVAWWMGKTETNVNYLFGEMDDESKMSHLWHAGCCIVFLIAFEARGMRKFDDRPGVDNFVSGVEGGWVNEKGVGADLKFVGKPYTPGPRQAMPVTPEEAPGWYDDKS